MNKKFAFSILITVIALVFICANQSATAQTETGWSLLVERAVPVARAYHSMAYDSIRDVVVMYAGGPHQDWSTHEYEDGQWTQYVTSEYPYINYAAMAFDPENKETVLYAGSVTWTWDGNVWNDFYPESYPSPRYFPSMAYDPSMGQIILFGGESAGVMMDDMWAWDRANETWEPVTQIGQRPSARWSAGMASDGSQVFLYGGGTRSVNFDDTWVWDGNAWNEFQDASEPGSRQGLSMASDGSRVVLFGGCAYPGECYGDLWGWNTADERWDLLVEQGPEARAYAAMATYSDDRVVLFGGVDLYRKTFKDTWEWDGQAWINTIDPASSIGTGHSRMAYDRVHDKAVLFGGEIWPGTGLSSIGETWIWDSLLGAWDKVDLAGGPQPSPRANHGMAFYEEDGYTLLFGGAQHAQWPGGEICRNDTWKWDGVGWQELDPGGPSSPPCRLDMGMAYDSDLNRVVVFGGWMGTGGSQLDDMWSWEDGAWTPLTTSTEYPDPRFGLAIAYDPDRGRLVIFGGTDVNDNRLDDTWEYDNGEWQEIITQNAPPPSAYNRMVYDESSNRMLMMGYQVGGLWEYTGADWEFVMDGVDNPSARNGSAIVYDETRESILLFAGNMLDDTWEYKSAPLPPDEPMVCLYASDGTTGLEGGVVKYYTAGWQPFGETGPDGCVQNDIEDGQYTFRMGYGGATLDLVQDISIDPVVVFQTTSVTAELRDSQGLLIDSGVVQYYASGWKDFGTTSGGQVSKELLPKSYTFRIRYGGATMDITQDVSIDPVVIFQTTNITAELRDSQSQLIDTGVVQYYASGWNDFGTTSGGQVSKELLPKSYTFRMRYGGATMNINQDVSIDPVVVFQTAGVTVELRDSQGSLIDPGVVQYYASGWKDFGTTSGGQVSMELLPKSYTFRMRYGGATMNLTQDVSTDAVVVFQTTLVTVELRDSQGQLIDTGFVLYYAGGWKDFGSTNGGQVSKELLPKSYTFRMRYAGAAIDQTQDVSSDPWVTFSTGFVQSESGTCTHYYAGGWRVFLNPMELLPGSYTFRFNDGTPDTVFDILASEVNLIQ